MPKIAIITDTDASLPAEIAAQHGIIQVPIMILFGEESLRTELDLTDAQMFARIDQEGKLPTTAAPSPGDFVVAFQEAFDQGADEILCVNISTALSATCNNALLAAKEFEGKRIEVVDSYTVSMGQGYAVLAAAEAVANGASLAEAAGVARSVAGRSMVYAALDTLKYLAMSGRVGQVAAGLSGLLSIKPILSVQDGKLGMLEKARTRKRAWQRVIDLTLADLAGQSPESLCVVHVAVPDEARRFADMVAEQIDCPAPVEVMSLTAGLSVHTGSGMVGIAFVKKP